MLLHPRPTDPGPGRHGLVGGPAVRLSPDLQALHPELRPQGRE
ncbi:hypothetical protein MUK42_17145 [Musa troglodytarum]|uniref:Uncharacterized protein n=1 Tax=Musa troglodytarum TaxID=320322 RepID=A0A9E7HE55_9LILI|nr:hypothetical protein MUK42_17145 [Musa troglodytarum]